MVMDGVDTMSKAELVILCEKHKLDGGKTVASMRYTLKKFYEEHTEPDAKKLKVDPLAKAASSSTVAAPPAGVCLQGESCSNLHSLSHRVALKHGGEFRDNPIKCRDGMACTKLRDREHLKKYAHEDDLDKVCKHGADCPELHILDHRVKYEHPGFRAQPVICRDGAACSMIKDRGHLYKYAHDVAPTPAAVSPIHVVVSAPAPAPPPADVVSVTPTTPTLSLSSTSASTSVLTPTTIASPASLLSKCLEDYPIESATEAVLIPIDKNCEEFWDLEEKFSAHLQGRNDDYVANRIKKGKKQMRFVLIGAEKVSNPVLEARFEIKKAMILKERAGGSEPCRERVSFHGTHPKNIKSILKTGLLRFQHPLNPCKTQVDDGYFGSNKKGIYVSRYADYTLKYSNRVCPVEPSDEVKTIMFRTMPGKSKHIEKLSGPIDPAPGHDSHSSPTFLEWFLFDEAQCCPQYVLLIKAMEDTRTAADDE